MPPVMFSVITKYHKGRHSLFLYNSEIFYAFTQDILRSPKNSSIHRIMNDFITINTLFRIGVVPKSKGVGSELKRKIKNLVVYVKYYCNMSVNQLLDLYEEFVDHFHLESKHFKEIAAALKNFEIQQQSAIKKFLSSDKPNSFAHDTYGIPNEYFGFREKITKTDYSFDN